MTYSIYQYDFRSIIIQHLRLSKGVYTQSNLSSNTLNQLVSHHFIGSASHQSNHCVSSPANFRNHSPRCRSRLSYLQSEAKKKTFVFIFEFYFCSGLRKRIFDITRGHLGWRVACLIETICAYGAYVPTGGNRSRAALCGYLPPKYV